MLKLLLPLLKRELKSLKKDLRPRRRSSRFNPREKSLKLNSVTLRPRNLLRCLRLNLKSRKRRKSLKKRKPKKRRLNR